METVLLYSNDMQGLFLVSAGRVREDHLILVFRCERDDNLEGDTEPDCVFRVPQPIRSGSTPFTAFVA